LPASPLRSEAGNAADEDPLLGMFKGLTKMRFPSPTYSNY
jgi:hypothetical protein